MIERALLKGGHQVVTANNGKSALALLATGHFDLVVTDIVMPDMEGLELTRSIRKTKMSIKIIAMSGGGRGSAGDYLTLAKTFGAAATLEKPFDIETLTNTVNDVLGAK